MAKVSLPRAFILEWNSTRPQPSPRSTSEAPGVLLAHAALRPSRAARSTTPGARGHRRDARRGRTSVSRPSASFVEALAARGEQALDERRDGAALGAARAPRRRRDAQGVQRAGTGPCPSRSPTPWRGRSDTTSSAISGTQRGGVERGRREHAPQELRRLVLAGHELARAARRGRPCSAAASSDGELRLLPRPVLEGLPVEGEDLLAVLLVEAGAGLLAQPARARPSSFMKSGTWKTSRSGSLGHGVVEVLGDLDAHVDAGDVGGAEGRALGAADGGAGQGVDLLDRQVRAPAWPAAPRRSRRSRCGWR